MDARQNESPTAIEMLRFVRRWPGMSAHGYVFSRRRDERHVTLDGVECDLREVPVEAVAKVRAAFKTFCSGANECTDANMKLFASWG
jgi:hypothetical protein